MYVYVQSTNLTQINKDFTISYIDAYVYIYIYLHIEEKSDIFTIVFKAIKIFTLKFPSVIQRWF